MLSVVGLEDDAIDEVCKEANVTVANYLFAKGRVLSGTVDNIRRAKLAAEAKQCTRAAPLAVSGAFHSPYMEPARQELVEALEGIDCKELRCNVYANIDCQPYTVASHQGQVVEATGVAGPVGAIV